MPSPLPPPPQASQQQVLALKSTAESAAAPTGNGGSRLGGWGAAVQAISALFGVLLLLQLL